MTPVSAVFTRPSSLCVSVSPVSVFHKNTFIGFGVHPKLRMILSWDSYILKTLFPNEVTFIDLGGHFLEEPLQFNPPHSIILYSQSPVVRITWLNFCVCDDVIQFSSVAQLCPTLCDPMDCSTPGLPVHHQLPEFTHTHVHWVSDAIHPLLYPSPPAFSISQHQGLFKWVSSLHQVAKVLEFQLQHQSFHEYSGLMNEYSGLMIILFDNIVMLLVFDFRVCFFFYLI